MLYFIFELRQLLDDALALLALLSLVDVGYGAMKIVNCAGLQKSEEKK